MIYATRPISANAEIYNCYGPYFKQQETRERQKILKEQYSFDCCCEKCLLSDDCDDVTIPSSNFKVKESIDNLVFVFQDYCQFICQNTSCQKKIYVRDVETFHEYSKKVQCKHCDQNQNIRFAQALEKYLTSKQSLL
jgi:hypothetical protein